MDDDGETTYKTRQRIHNTLILVDQCLRLMGDKMIPDSAEPRLESFYPPFVAGIYLPHQGVVDSHNPIQLFFCKWSFAIWKFTCETHGLHTQVFGFSSKVKMCKHLNSPQNICASTNPGNHLWKYFIFTDTLLIRDIYKHHNFTWKPWTFPCLIYQVQSFGCHTRCSIPAHTPNWYDTYCRSNKPRTTAV